VYIDTALGKKLARAGISAAMLALTSETSRADISNFIHGRKSRIGRERRKRIFNALCEIGLVKRRICRPPVCKNCGTAYPTRKIERELIKS
jgi:hypothetical protein